MNVFVFHAEKKKMKLKRVKIPKIKLRFVELDDEGPCLLLTVKEFNKIQESIGVLKDNIEILKQRIKNGSSDKDQII